MVKTTCDICGKEMRSSNSQPISTYKFCISSYGKQWDVCLDCRDKLFKWIEARKALKDICEVKMVASCRTCVWRADHVLKVSGREKSLCPIEQHYVLPEDGFCHLYESDKKISDERIKGLAEGKE